MKQQPVPVQQVSLFDTDTQDAPQIHQMAQAESQASEPSSTLPAPDGQTAPSWQDALVGYVGAWK